LKEKDEKEGESYSLRGKKHEKGKSEVNQYQKGVGIKKKESLSGKGSGKNGKAKTQLTK